MTALFEFLAKNGHFIFLPWGSTFYLYTGPTPHAVTAKVAVNMGGVSHSATISMDANGVITVSDVK